MSKFDFSVFHNSESDTWVDLIDDDSAQIPQIVLSLADNFLWYPNDSLKILLVAYCLVPSALSSRLPLLFLYGTSGSGKSTAGKFIAKVRGKSILSSSDTFASIRNYLNETKFHEDSTIEKNCILVWDDIDPNVLTTKEDIFRMLKVGYDRQTQWISISSMKAGQNLRFPTFSPKVISSIHPVWTYPKLSELDRRSIVIPHKKPLESVELLDLDCFSFKGLRELYDQFWMNEETCKFFLTFRKKFVRKRFDWISSEDKLLMADLISTVFICNLLESEEKIYDWLKEYWLNFLKPIKNKSSLAFIELLQEYVLEHKKREDKLGAIFPIDAKNLLETCKNWSSEGKIETYITPITLGDYMGKLGYKLTKNGWEKLDE